MRDDIAEIKACAFYGTMAAVFTSGASLTMDSTITQAVGTAMVFWVIGFFFAMTGFMHIRKEAENTKESE